MLTFSCPPFNMCPFWYYKFLTTKSKASRSFTSVYLVKCTLSIKLKLFCRDCNTYKLPRVSQLYEVIPPVQLHVNPIKLSSAVQVPPFKQGLKSQGSPANISKSCPLLFFYKILTQRKLVRVAGWYLKASREEGTGIQSTS